MRFYGVLVFAIWATACLEQPSETKDLGIPAENDLSLPADLSSTDGSGGDWRTLSIIAGSPGGRGNVDDTGPVARFGSPSSVATDGLGNLYVTDSSNHTIRKVVLASGAVSTIAGAADTPGSADGIGTTARFRDPYGLVLDGMGSLYVTDRSNRTVRKVALASGVVTTIAGAPGISGGLDGVGSAARFGSPSGISLDSSGNLYVADSGNYTIRKIVLSTAIVSTIAGTTGMFGSSDGVGAAARFFDPLGVAADGAGNLYVADRGALTIRKIVLATGLVSTIAGTAGMTGSTDGVGSVARFSSPVGLSLDGVGGLYIADTDNSTIRRLILATGGVSTIAGTAGMSGSVDGTGSAARFASASGLATDPAGNIYVADSGNSTIRCIAFGTRSVSTIAGRAIVFGSADGASAVAQINTVYGLTTDSAGNLYFTDAGKNAIRKIESATSSVSTVVGGTFGSADGIGAAAQFRVPYGVTSDGAGNLYVSDSANNTVRKVILATGAVSTIVGIAGMPGSADGVGIAARLSFPTGVWADRVGNLFVSDAGNYTIRKVVLSTGLVSTIAGNVGMSGNADGIGVSARFGGAYGIGSDGNGYLYVADTANHTIRKVDLASGAVTTIAGVAGSPGTTDGTGATSRFRTPYDVTADRSGNLYVADTGNSTIRRIALANADVITILGLAGQAGVKLGPVPARLNTPGAVSVQPSGGLYIANLAENVILRAN